MKQILLIIGIIFSICFAEKQNQKLDFEGKKAQEYLLVELQSYWEAKDYKSLEYIFKQNLALEESDPTLLHEGRFVFCLISRDLKSYINSNKKLIKMSEQLGIADSISQRYLEETKEITEEQFTEGSTQAYLESLHKKGNPAAPFQLKGILYYRNLLQDPEYIAPEVLQIFKDVEEGKHLESTQLANNQTTKTKINPNLLATNTPQVNQPKQTTQQTKPQAEQTATTTASEQQSPTWLIYTLVALGLVVLLLVVKKLQNKE